MRFLKLKKKFQPFLGQQGKHQKKFHIIIQKNLKIISHCVEFYEHGKLSFIPF